MNKIHIAPAWDGLGHEVKAVLASYSIFRDVWDKNIRTRFPPLRTPDDIPQPERELLWNKWNRMSWDDVYRDIIRTATRPPKKSAVERMDDLIMIGRGDVPWSNLCDTWQAVKAEIADD